MNKRVKIISICFSIAILSGGVILALTSFSKEKYNIDETPKVMYNMGGEPKRDPEEDKIKMGLVKDPTAEEESNYSKEGDEKDLEELQKKLDSIDAEDDKLDKKDLKAYSILAKYYDSSYNRDFLVDSVSTECAYLQKMIELLRENKVTDNEKTVLVNYIDRRTEWLLGYEETEVKELLEEMEQAVKEYR